MTQEPHRYCMRVLAPVLFLCVLEFETEFIKGAPASPSSTNGSFSLAHRATDVRRENGSSRSAVVPESELLRTLAYFETVQ